MDSIVDLRSDTITRPTPEMRAILSDAEVGDDVLGDDPTVHRLQERMAALTGKEAALFVPSGSMANLCAIRSATEPGDEIIADATTHCYHYETAAPFAVAGCSMRFVDGRHGVFTARDVEAALRPRASHFPFSRMVVVENTNNRGGGTVWPLETIADIRTVADQNGLHVHIDGARLWNACIATGKKPADYARYADSVSMCFSKGLGAPVGSIVAGTREFVTRAHRFRKMFGGAMRQAGILAAAAIHAVEHHYERLIEDHRNARTFAEGIAEIPGIKLDPKNVPTNIVIFEVDERHGSAAEFGQRLEAAGVRTLATGPTTLRAVTHLDVNRAAVERAVEIVRDQCASRTVSG